MTTPAVAEHTELAKSFLQRSKSYLEKGDLHQALEKGWGASSHIIKAVAAANGWEYEHHDQFDGVVVILVIGACNRVSETKQTQPTDPISASTNAASS